jgi:glycerol-1-phosphatase
MCTRPTRLWGRAVVSEPRRLKSTAEPLMHSYDCAMVDLDGVVYRGAQAVEGVTADLDAAREAGMRLAFVTNNAARTPEQVSAHLSSLGVRADPSDVVTSAQAAARALTELVPPGSAVLVVGGEGLHVAITERGFRVVKSADDEPAAVVQGFHPSVDWPLLAEGAYAARRGIPWVASNVDLTVPTARGIAPGNGTLVRAVAAAAAREPTMVAGKPFRPLFDETIDRVGARRPVVVGDRLDTDIEGAAAADADSLLVLTGVTNLSAACAAVGRQRPSYIARTLRGLATAHPAPDRRPDGPGAELDGWQVRFDGHDLVIAAAGDDPDDGLRAVVQAAWWQIDEGSSLDQMGGLDDVATKLGVDP